MVDKKTVTIAVILLVILSTLLSYGVIMTVPQVQNILRGSKGEQGEFEPQGEMGPQGISGIICPSLKEEVDDSEIDMSDIIKDLEKMIKRAEKKNAEIVPKALLRIIRLQQLNIKLIDEMRRGR